MYTIILEVFEQNTFFQSQCITLEIAIIEAFDRVYNFFLLCPKYTWSINQKLQKQTKTLLYLEHYFK